MNTDKSMAYPIEAGYGFDDDCTYHESSEFYTDDTYTDKKMFSGDIGYTFHTIYRKIGPFDSIALTNGLYELALMECGPDQSKWWPDMDSPPSIVILPDPVQFPRSRQRIEVYRGNVMVAIAEGITI